MVANTIAASGTVNNTMLVRLTSARVAAEPEQQLRRDEKEDGVAEEPAAPEHVEQLKRGDLRGYAHTTSFFIIEAIARSRCGCPVNTRSFCTEPAYPTRPARKNTISSASSSSSLITCDVTSTVLPSLRSLRILSLSTAFATGSSPALGSSSTSTRGANRNASATASFCRVPPDNARTRVSRCGASASRSNNSQSITADSPRNPSRIFVTSRAVRCSGKRLICDAYPTVAR